MTRTAPVQHTIMHMGTDMTIRHYAPGAHAKQGWISVENASDTSSGFSLFPCTDHVTAIAQLTALAEAATALAGILQGQSR
jgi:hypothetical protein